MTDSAVIESSENILLLLLLFLFVNMCIINFVVCMAESDDQLRSLFTDLMMTSQRSKQHSGITTHWLRLSCLQ